MSDTNRVAQASMPTRASTKPLKDCRTLGDALGTVEFKKLVAESVPKHVSGDRMLRTFNQAVSKSPDLMKCSMRSVIGQFLTLSQLGFEPNTPLGHAYMIPFKAKVYNRETRRMEDGGYEANLILGYQGLLDLSYRSALMTGMHCDVAWAKDDFSFEYGTDAHLRHRPRGVRIKDEQPEYAYMHARLRDGQAFEVLPYSEIIRIRNLSQGYRAALAAKDAAEGKGWQQPKAWTEAPWVKHEIAMARKTALRHGSKWLPRSVELAGALALDEASDRRTIDYSDVFQAAVVDQDSDYLSVATDVAEVSGDAGATFGVRERQDEPAQKQGQSRTDPERPADNVGQTRPAAAAPSTEQKREPAPAEFEAYLADEVGEVTDDVFIDPKAFIYALINLANLTSNETALREHNADAIEQACELSAEARQKYETWVRNRDMEEVARAAGGDGVTFVPLAVVEIRGRPDWAGYHKSFKGLLAETPPIRLPDFIEFHRPTWKDASAAQRMLIVKAIVDRCRGAGVPQPDWLAGMMTTAKVAPQTEPPQQRGMPLDEPQQQRREAAPRTAEDETATPERVERWSKRVGAELLAMKTAEEFVAWEDDPDNKERRDLIRQDWPQHSAYVEAAVSGAFQRLMKTAGPAS